MNRISRRITVLLVILIGLVTLLSIKSGTENSVYTTRLHAAPLMQSDVGTAFTYQGRLTQNNLPANGDFEFRFSLHDAPTEGAIIDGTSSIDKTITASNGTFTTVLDFGPRAFVGGGVWLKISVRAVGGGAFNPLTPRQRLSAAPYATFASQTSWDGIVGLPAGFADGEDDDSDTTYTDGAGLTLTNGEFSVDTTVIQARVSGTCPNGQSIQAIAQDGTVTCSSGVDISNVQTRVTGACPAGESIRAIAENGNVTCEPDNIGLTNPITFLQVEGGAEGGINAKNNSDEFITVLIENSGVANALIARNGGDEFPAIFVENTATTSQIDIGGVNGIRALTDREAETGIVGLANGGTETDINSIFEDDTTFATGGKFIGGNGMIAAGNEEDGGFGILGVASQKSGNTRGVGISGYAREGESGTNLAGLFFGDVQINGNLSKSSGSFKIDHPLDPANKYLYHSFVESPDMMNVYNGNVVLDANGSAVVQLPTYFEALNRDFRYQLTALGAPGPNLYIADKIVNNQFRIAGGQPNSEVSWQITGIRHDPYAEAHRLQVEVDKPAAEAGTYLHPELYGQPGTLSKKANWLQQPTNAQPDANVSSVQSADVVSPEDPSASRRARSSRK